MITIRNIEHRLAYVEKILTLYQGEKEALIALTSIYKDSAYQDIRELEKLTEKQDPHISKMEIPKEIPIIPVASPVQKMLASEQYQKMLLYIALHVDENNKVRMAIDAETAKEVGVSSGTLSNYKNMMVSLGKLRKLDRGTYKLSLAFQEELEHWRDNDM